MTESNISIENGRNRALNLGFQFQNSNHVVAEKYVEPANNTKKKTIGLSCFSKIINILKSEKSKLLLSITASKKNVHRSIPTALSDTHASIDHIHESLPSNRVHSQEEVNNSSRSTHSHEKDIVPLRQFLRYSMDRSDRRTFHRRRIIQPFQPRYEIEWQKDQWLQLDNATSKEIERLRRNGFSKVAIREDATLKKYIMYDNPSELDVLLEVLLDKNLKKINTECEPQPILCHQPTRFSIRRTHWWHNSYKIGEAHLPNWVDPDLCCHAVIMDASSVMAVITNGSRTSLSSSANNNINIKFPDTPALSQKSSVNHLRTSSSSWSIKPLQYTEPPFLLEEHVLSAAVKVN